MASVRSMSNRQRSSHCENKCLYLTLFSVYYTPHAGVHVSLHYSGGLHLNLNLPGVVSELGSHGSALILLSSNAMQKPMDIDTERKGRGADHRWNLRERTFSEEDAWKNKLK